MSCETYDLGNGVTLIGCTRGEPKRLCQFCGAKATKLCDRELTGKKKGSTCSAPMCARCSIRIGKNLDLCPPHARERDMQTKMRDATRLSQETREEREADAWLAGIIAAQEREANEVDRAALAQMFPDWENDWHVPPDAPRGMVRAVRDGLVSPPEPVVIWEGSEVANTIGLDPPGTYSPSLPQICGTSYERDREEAAHAQSISAEGLARSSSWADAHARLSLAGLQEAVPAGDVGLQRALVSAPKCSLRDKDLAQRCAARARSDALAVACISQRHARGRRVDHAQSDRRTRRRRR